MFVCHSLLYLALFCQEAAECNTAEVKFNFCASLKAYMASAKPTIIEHGPNHNTGWRMVTCTRFLFPSKGNDIFAMKWKHQLLTALFECAVFTVEIGKKSPDPGQADVLWTVSFRNVQHVRNFMFMFGYFSLILCWVICLVNGSVADLVMCLNCQWT